MNILQTLSQIYFYLIPIRYQIGVFRPDHNSYFFDSGRDYPVVLEKQGKSQYQREMIFAGGQYITRATYSGEIRYFQNPKRFYEESFLLDIKHNLIDKCVYFMDSNSPFSLKHFIVNSWYTLFPSRKLIGHVLFTDDVFSDGITSQIERPLFLRRVGGWTEEYTINDDGEYIIVMHDCVQKVYISDNDH